MAGEHLFEFDCDLCEYVVGNIRQHLGGVERPKHTGMLRPSELELLDFPHWFTRQLGGRFMSLAARIWAGVFSEVPRIPMIDFELFELTAVLDDVPDRLARTCVWEPYPALHAQSVKCVSEIRSELTQRNAEEWAEASAEFAARLCTRPLSLAEGVSVVGDWVRLARRLRGAMGTACVPATTPAASTPIARDVGAAKQPVAGLAKGKPVLAQPQSTGAGDAAVCGWREAMAVTGLKKTRLYELFRDGALKGYRDGRMVRFYRTGLTDYMRERENVTPPPSHPARRPRAKKSRALPATRFRFLR